MADLVSDVCAYARTALAAAADPDKAARMQAHMRTDMPFYGVQKPARAPVLRHVVRHFPPVDRDEYERSVLGLWDLPHREEKYLALGVARSFGEHVVPDSLPLYRRLIVEGGWWDLVDEVATHLVRELVVSFPEAVWPEIDRWVDDGVLWLRRSAILCQVGAKEKTDAVQLFDFTTRRAHETEFFVRKAIGWALREYGKTDPKAVARYVTRHRDQLSPLTFREATKHIRDLVGE